MLIKKGEGLCGEASRHHLNEVIGVNIISNETVPCQIYKMGTEAQRGERDTTRLLGACPENTVSILCILIKKALTSIYLSKHQTNPD